MNELPPLFKSVEGGRAAQWQIHVEPHDDGTGTIVIKHGRQLGKQQIIREHITKGKNVGKANETTPLAQAYAEAAARWKKQLDRKHYGLTVQESAIKRAAAPMLAHNYQDHEAKINWSGAVVQPKYDGLRCITTRTKDDVLFTSREGELFELPHLREPLLDIMDAGERLDGELYLHGTPLRKIMSYATRTQDATASLQYMVYDTPTEDAYDIRHALLRDIIDPSLQHDGILLAETYAVATPDQLMGIQAEFIENGYEGAMLRWGSRGYDAGKRSPHLLKVKTFMDQEFPIVGVKEGSSTFKGMAIFICATPAGHLFDVTAPGTHEEKQRAWRIRDQFQGCWVTVKFAGWTTTDEPKPFHPVAKLVKDEPARWPSQ